MTRFKSSYLITFLVLSAFSIISFAQERGEALYKTLNADNLLKTNGTANVEWLPDGQSLFHAEEDADSGTTKFFKIDIKSDKKQPLFDQKTQQKLIDGYNQLTNAGATNLPFTGFTHVMDGKAINYSVDNRHFLFDLKSMATRELLRPIVERQPESDGLMRRMPTTQLWNGEYSPDFNLFAYVKDYDLYLADTRTGKVTRLTEGGNENLLNGRPDWVYPEEFDQRTAYWWSPDSKKIAYYQFDESTVVQYPLVHDTGPRPKLEMQNYPKVGAANPIVKLFIIDLATNKHLELETESTTDNYIVNPKWLPDSSGLTFQRMNRLQNHLELFRSGLSDGKISLILEEKEEHFVNLHNDFIFLKDKQHFVWSSERSGWRHLYLYDINGSLVRQLTDGVEPLDELTGLDTTNTWAYYTAHTSLGLETQFFCVNLKTAESERLTPEPGSHRISLNPAGTYFTDTFTSFDVAGTTNLRAADGKLIRNLATTDTSRLDELGLIQPELVVVKAADGITDLHGLLYKPAHFDPSETYPLIVSVYGGPHTKSVRNRYRMDAVEQRIAQLGYLVWEMDNRGLRQRGKAFETATYLKLGQVDLADQTAGVKQITQRPYIDGSRVGIYGGSYGGYMTCMALLKEPEVFQVGCAGAPVTDWRNYDSIYTERYMRTPKENPQGYELGSALNIAGNLQGQLLLSHGTVDNNVHPGQSIQLINKLVEQQKFFEVMFYPNERHSMSAPSRRHYNTLRLNFFEKHLNPKKPEASVQ